MTPLISRPSRAYGTKMRILEIAGSGSVGTDRMGPVSGVICSLSNHFHALGHDVTVIDAIAEQPRPYMTREIDMLEVQVPPRGHVSKRLTSNRLRILLSWLHEYRFVKFLSRVVDFDSFDVVHVHEHFPAIILTRHCKERLSYTSHTPLWFREDRFKNNNEIKYERIQKLLRIHELDLFKRCSLAIAPGGFLRSVCPNSNIEVIQNGIDLNEWNPMDKTEARRGLGITDEEFIVLLVARIDPVKGFDVLLDAVRKLTRVLNNFRVIVIGSPSGIFGGEMSTTPYARRILSQAKGLPIEFKGFIHNRSEKFQTCMSAADLFVLTSLFESQGMVILEALAMGLPVVASRVGGIPDLIAPNVGCLFEVGNSVDLAQKIQYLHHNRNHLKAMQFNCRKHVQDNFTWNITAEKYLKAFERVRKKLPPP
jgi:glycosyltransferase involved in cell wall biosynthesis